MLKVNGSIDRGVMTMEDSTFEETGQERDWLGPKNEQAHLIYHAQSETTEQEWFFSSDLIALDPDYSEFSVSIEDPRCRSLSFINRTIAILPKSKLRIIYNLIGAYLEKIDSQNS